MLSLYTSIHPLPMGKHDIPHRTTVSDEIVAKSMKVKGLIVKQLKNSDSQISFTFDTGTS
jgi:hypothetical protein